jgi:hypothetical protein
MLQGMLGGRSCVIDNVSESGCRVRTGGKGLEVGVAYKLVLGLDGGSTEAEAYRIRQEEREGALVTGMGFRECPSAVREYLSRRRAASR